MRYPTGIFFFVLLTFTGVVSPILAATCFLDWKPVDEDIAVWIQRSGAIVIICAIYIEFNRYSMSRRMAQQDVNNDNYQNTYSIMTTFFVLLSIFGTLIWGYGDIWIKDFLEHFQLEFK